MPRPKSPTRTLTSVLVESGIITDAQVEQAVVRQRESGHMIGETLVELGFTSEENIGWALSKQLGIPYVDVRPEAIDAAEVKRFPESLLRRVQAIPQFGSRNELAVAMADPTDQDAVAELRQTASGALSLVIGAPGSIRRAIDAIYGSGRETAAASAVATPSGGGGAPAAQHDVVWDRAGGNLLSFHLHSARTKNASEVHFVPVEGGVSIYYRTDAGLEEQPGEKTESGVYLRARLGVLGISDLEGSSEFHTAGEIPIQVGAESLTLYVSNCRSPKGVATVIRLTPRPAQAPDLSTLGVSPIAEAEIREMVDGPEGVVIVHGPPRSGGSLILGALAALAARSNRRMLALEPNTCTPYPDSLTRVVFANRADALARWAGLVIGQGADVALLDDVMRGDSVAQILGGASVGRLVFARTDWLDGDELLTFLARSPHGKLVIRERPFALISLPNARRDGSRVWAQSEDQPASLISKVLTDEDRDAILSRTTG